MELRGLRASSRCEGQHRTQKCILNIEAPRHRCDKFKKILQPILRRFDPSNVCVHINEDQTLSKLPPGMQFQHGGNIPRYQDNKALLSTPALAVMLFLQERGTTPVQDVQKCFKKPPWRVHHKIELQSKRTPSVKVAQQEFYSLSREYPLWSVCPVYSGFEHLRLNLFVNNFSDMVEFYRLVTDSEMESTKPDFCLFPVSSDGDFQVMLCLKRCRHLKPFPLSRANISFKIRNIADLQSVLRTDLREIGKNTYITTDPDGNRLILEDVNHISSSSGYHKDKTSHVADVICDVTSLKSVCGSHDSGRYSDSDQCSCELEVKESKKVHFSENTNERTFVYNTDPIVDRKEKAVKYMSTARDMDLSFEDYYDETSPKCYPGMVIAHARMIVNRNEIQHGVKEKSRNKTDDHVWPSCNGQGRYSGHGKYSGQSVQSSARVPIVTVTDCSGNVHNCIERVIHPNTTHAESNSHVEPIYENIPFGFSDSKDQSCDVVMCIPKDSVSERDSFVISDSENYPSDVQTQNLPIVSGGKDEGREGTLDREGGALTSVSSGLENVKDEARFVKNLREDVIKKRHVEPVYI
ncbi:uncharacterized protein LOC124151314 [Haliotis rufescens]|uniref:uncharacterized protein LOC124151314 n=1 Tax=Haliotis rufescens TaxID=6454 RepID=UPI00201F5322|nr:uncharacterized protein LOC124151314 [Haliotis rufescens]